MDFSLIQALQETRNLAAGHEGEPGWEQVQARVDRLLDQLTIEVHDVGVPEGGADRIDRDAIGDPETAERAVAALLAIADRTVGDELELADQALEDLEDAIG